MHLVLWFLVYSPSDSKMEILLAVTEGRVLQSWTGEDQREEAQQKPSEHSSTVKTNLFSKQPWQSSKQEQGKADRCSSCVMRNHVGELQVDLWKAELPKSRLWAELHCPSLVLRAHSVHRALSLQ